MVPPSIRNRNGAVVGIDPGRKTGWGIMDVGSSQSPELLYRKHGLIKYTSDDSFRRQLRDLFCMAASLGVTHAYIEDQYFEESEFPAQLCGTQAKVKVVTARSLRALIPLVRRAAWAEQEAWRAGLTIERVQASKWRTSVFGNYSARLKHDALKRMAMDTVTKTFRLKLDMTIDEAEGLLISFYGAVDVWSARGAARAAKRTRRTEH